MLLNPKSNLVMTEDNKGLSGDWPMRHHRQQQLQPTSDKSSYAMIMRMLHTVELSEDEARHRIALALSMLIGLSDPFWKMGEQGRADGLLALVFNHPASNPESKQWVQQLLARDPMPGHSADDDFHTVALSPLHELSLDEDSPESGRCTDWRLIDPLSGRELEILHLVAAGLSNADIAQALYIAQATVKVHSRNIFSKLNVSSRTQAVAQAHKLKLL